MHNVVNMFRYYYILALLHLLQACELSPYTVLFKDDDCVRQKTFGVNVTACRGNCLSSSIPTKKQVSLHGQFQLQPQQDCKCCTMETWEVRQIAIKKCRRNKRGGRKQVHILYDTMSALKCSCRSCGQEYTVRDSNYLNSKKFARSAGLDAFSEDFFMEDEVRSEVGHHQQHRQYSNEDGRSRDLEQGTTETLNHSSESYDLR